MLEKYLKNDIIVQHDGDSGDSCQRTATFIFLNIICGIKNNELFSKMLFQIQSSRGRFRRSNDKNHWGFRPSNCSRDQVSIARIAMASFNYKKPFVLSYWQQLLRIGFHQNFLKGTDDINERWKTPDFISPAEIAILIRGLNLWILWPVLFILDLLKSFDIIFRDDENWDQDNMLSQHLYFSVLKMSTPISVFNLAFYLRTNYMSRILNYYSLENNGIPPMIDLFKQAETKMKEYLWETFYYVRFLLR